MSVCASGNASTKTLEHLALALVMPRVYQCEECTLTENRVGARQRDRRFLTMIVGIAAVFTLALLIFAFVTDFPGPPPSGDKELTPDAPAEDVRR